MRTYPITDEAGVMFEFEIDIPPWGFAALLRGIDGVSDVRERPPICRLRRTCLVSLPGSPLHRLGVVWRQQPMVDRPRGLYSARIPSGKRQPASGPLPPALSSSHVLRTLWPLLFDLLRLSRSTRRSRSHLAAENLFLRKQLACYVERQVRPKRPDNATRITLALLSRAVAWRELLTIVPPDTLVRWHRDLYRLFLRAKSTPRGRPRIPADLQQLIADIAAANHTWGEERIAAELRLEVGLTCRPDGSALYAGLTCRPDGSALYATASPATRRPVGSRGLRSSTTIRARSSPATSLWSSPRRSSACTSSSSSTSRSGESRTVRKAHPRSFTRIYAAAR